MGMWEEFFLMNQFCLLQVEEFKSLQAQVLGNIGKAILTIQEINGRLDLDADFGIREVSKMLKKSIIAKTVLDGFIQSFALYLICAISTTELVSDNFVTIFAIAILVPVGIAAIYQNIIRKQTIAKNVVLLSIIDFGCFCVFTVLILALQVVQPLKITHQRELNNADGIILLLVLGTFLATTLLIRIVLIVYSLVKKH